jgi:hypothetical protein
LGHWSSGIMLTMHKICEAQCSRLG